MAGKDVGTQTQLEQFSIFTPREPPAMTCRVHALVEKFGGKALSQRNADDIPPDAQDFDSQDVETTVAGTQRPSWLVVDISDELELCSKEPTASVSLRADCSLKLIYKVMCTAPHAVTISPSKGKLDPGASQAISLNLVSKGKGVIRFKIMAAPLHDGCDVAMVDWSKVPCVQKV